MILSLLLHRYEGRKYFSQIRRHDKKYVFLSENQGLTCEIVKIFSGSTGNALILDPQRSCFTLAESGLFKYCSEKGVRSSARAMDNRITITDLLKAKQERRPVVAVSCYDYTTARLVSQAPVDIILVGDSAAQLMLGFNSTLPATMDFMVAITAAVRRGAPDVYLVADMPFLSYQISIAEAIRNAGRFLTEAGVQMVKIEATAAHVPTVKAVTDAGIAVMAHIGIRPQRISTIGRLRAEATTADMAIELIELARQMIEAGSGALLIEGTAAEVAQIIAERSDVPVISCGSGSGCDGQILIAPDILGLSQGRLPKFTRAYDELGVRAIEAVRAYADDVRARRFPDAEHSYHMKDCELSRLKELLRPAP